MFGGASVVVIIFEKAVEGVSVRVTRQIFRLVKFDCHLAPRCEKNRVGEKDQKRFFQDGSDPRFVPGRPAERASPKSLRAYQNNPDIGTFLQDSFDGTVCAERFLASCGRFFPPAR